MAIMVLITIIYCSLVQSYCCFNMMLVDFHLNSLLNSAIISVNPLWQ